MTFRTHILPFTAPVVIILSSLVLASGWFVALSPELAMGILYDLTLLSPLLYLALIWKRDIPRITAVPVFIIGLVLSTILLPTDTVHYFTMRNIVLPLIELTVLGFITYQTVRTIRLYKSLAKGRADFLTVFRACALQMVPHARVANILTTEAGMIYYALFAWRFPKAQSGEYSLHRKSGSMALFGVIIFLILAETFVLHILLVQWNPLVAWILFGLSLYTAIQVLGHMKALRLRPVTLTATHLHLRYGLFGDANIPLHLLASAEVSAKALPEGESSGKLSLLADLEPHNVVIRLKEQVGLTKAYGMQEAHTTFCFYVDEPEALVAQLNA